MVLLCRFYVRGSKLEPSRGGCTNHEAKVERVTRYMPKRLPSRRSERSHALYQAGLKKTRKTKGCVGLTPSASFGIENLELARGLVVTPLPPTTFSPLTPTAAAITPTAFTPTVSPIPPAVVPIAPSGQLGATLVGILFGLFDHRVADASDSF